MSINVIDLGIILATTGIVLGLWKEKRKFNRVNAFGIEQFPSFTKKLIATMFDRLLYLVALVLLGVGLFILAFA